MLLRSIVSRCCRVQTKYLSHHTNSNTIYKLHHRKSRPYSCSRRCPTLSPRETITRSNMTDGHKHTNGSATSATSSQPPPATVEHRPVVTMSGPPKPTPSSSTTDEAAPPVVDPLLSPTYFASYDALDALCRNNVTHFAGDESDSGQRFRCAFAVLVEHLATVRSMADQIRQFAAEYDFDPRTPGNGYRSFLLVVRSCIAHTLKVGTHVTQNRSSLLFRRQLYAREVEAASHLLASLCTCLRHLLTLRDWSEPGSLFPRGFHSAAELFDTADSINQYSFYGRCIGIQYCESMQNVVRFLAVCMAGFSEAYYKDGTTFSKTTASMWTSGKYYMNPELRARRIVNISQNAEIDFCKSFWSLTEGELMQTLPSVLGTAIKVNCTIDIPAEPLQLPKVASIRAGSAVEEFVDIPVPSSHLGSSGATISARLLSAGRRRGMMGERDNASSAREPSAGLIVHCHGGGFVAQSSKSHEIYLRDWAVALDVPILSIDYSLAPAAPFPRAVEEVFYAYCWALKNCALLGTTADRVLLAGDSAGANLNLACAIRCIETGVRKPDGIFLAYCPVRISFDPSPARLLCLMDPLLPFGFMMRCLKAYACPNATIIEQNRAQVEEVERIRGAVGAGTVSASGSMQSVSIGVPEAAATTTFADSTNPSFMSVPRSATTTSAADRERSGSLDGSSLWEHIENDFAQQEQRSAAGCSDADDDGASDTYASASLRSHSSGGAAGNTELMTPDGSNGDSLEEDSQPITIHRPPHGLMAAQLRPEDGGDDDTEELVVLERKGDDDVRVHAQLSPVANGNANGMTAVPSSTMTRAEESIVLDAGRDALSVQNIQQKIIQVMDSVATQVTSRLQSMTASTPIRECQEFARVRQRLDAEQARNPSEEFVFEIPRDPLLSPYWASDEVLAQMPRTHILTVDMDPCLDDCVMFAKRLKQLGRPVTMDILPGLPHGFLNFVKLSKEAHAGNKVCVKRINELLNDELQE